MLGEDSWKSQKGKSDDLNPNGGGMSFQGNLHIVGRFWFLQFDQTSLVLEVGPAEDEVGAAGGAGVVMDAGAMLAIATLIQKMWLKRWKATNEGRHQVLVLESNEKPANYHCNTT